MEFPRTRKPPHDAFALADGAPVPRAWPVPPGRLADPRSVNLFWTCRACNVRCGNMLRNAGLGRLTNQYNPADAGALVGAVVDRCPVHDGRIRRDASSTAIEMIRATPPERRSRFATEICRRRRARYGPSGRSDGVPFLTAIGQQTLHGNTILSLRLLVEG